MNNTAPTKALYRAGDLLALKIAPEKPFPVVRDQQLHDTHVWVQIINHPEPEGLRNADVMVYGGTLPCTK